jgi:hypothetical protein
MLSVRLPAGILRLSYCVNVLVVTVVWDIIFPPVMLSHIDAWSTVAAPLEDDVNTISAVDEIELPEAAEVKYVAGVSATLLALPVMAVICSVPPGREPLDAVIYLVDTAAGVVFPTIQSSV